LSVQFERFEAPLDLDASNYISTRATSFEIHKDLRCIFKAARHHAGTRKSQHVRCWLRLTVATTTRFPSSSMRDNLFFAVVNAHTTATRCRPSKGGSFYLLRKLTSRGHLGIFGSFRITCVTCLFDSVCSILAWRSSLIVDHIQCPLTFETTASTPALRHYTFQPTFSLSRQMVWPRPQIRLIL
jgi:hypothetical protein